MTGLEWTLVLIAGFIGVLMLADAVFRYRTSQRAADRAHIEMMARIERGEDPS